MPVVALLMLQIASTAGPPAPGGTAAGSLAQPVPSRSCSTKPDEIVVCGRDADTYRLPKGVAEGKERGPPEAAWRVFGTAQMSVHSAQRTVGPGVSAPAAMVTIKLPF